MNISLFAQHSSIKQNIHFFHDSISKAISARVEIEKNDPVDEVNVEIPLYPLNPSFEGGILKTQSLLRNFHLRPTYQDEKIYFAQIPPENKKWEIHPHMIDFSEDAQTLCRLDGTIIYSCFNTLITWNYETNERQTSSLGTSKITSLVESPDGDIVCGDEKGHIYYRDQKFLVEKGTPIDHVYFINSENCLVHFPEKNQVLLYDVAEGKQVKEYSDVTSIAVLGLDKFALLQKKVLGIRTVKKDTVPLKEIEDVIQMKGLSPSKLVYRNLKKSNFCYDVDSDTSRDLENKNDYFCQNSYLLEGGTIVFHEQRLFLEFLSEKKSSYKTQGNWGIVRLLPLSDGSVMYATDTRGSGVHIMTQEGETIFSDQEVTGGGNMNVLGLTELTDGSVAIKFANQICILTPYLSDLKTKEHRIEEIHLELNYRPDILPLYQELIQLTKKPESSYKICKAGVQAAVKAKNIYQARRFYEQGRSLQPKDREIIDLFYHSLSFSTLPKLKRHLLLDRASFDGPASIPRSIFSRKTKKRLLVGEGDFSYTEALIKKHQKTHQTLARTITATDLFSPPEGGEVQNRLSFLEERGVKILVGINGAELHRFFPKKRFQRVQWNCPFPEAKKREGFEKRIPDFFLSCAKLQLPKDRIHVTLMQHDNEYTITRQKENPIVLGSTRAGYRLIRKRVFGESRYPGYNHVKTKSSERYNAEGKEREFVFEKVEGAPTLSSPTLEDAEKLKDPREKTYKIKKIESDQNALENYYFECSTDEDSSDYYESNSDDGGAETRNAMQYGDEPVEVEVATAKFQDLCPPN
ncbi:Rossmann-like fold-containing protein [Candidatus Neptunichlamydia sp. REUL1]|uniref:Rossmann-like fold-containing protein n=1 Tax=Candidatus Neptunichlamydia sp. REUL1 TaxID=3064277 RepID=UPI00292D301F|nr:Rossmann-like fold-containing protein [Candidatus Neptunochlamydia sp. REUL1]